MKNKFFSLWLALFIILIFIFQIAIPNLTDLLILNKSAFPEIWRFVTAIFLHASLQHLIFNLFALILFGLILEKLIGSNKFLIVFFLSGILANIISVFFYPVSLGASGAIFGIIGALTIIKPFMIVFAFNLPMPMFVAALLWAIGDILGIFYPSNVGNIAHLSGLALGIILGIFFRFKNNERTQLKADYKRINMPENYVRAWEDNYLKHSSEK